LAPNLRPWRDHAGQLTVEFPARSMPSPAGWRSPALAEGLVAEDELSLQPLRTFNVSTLDQGRAMVDSRIVEDLPLHVAGLRRYALALTGSPLEAEDLVQNTLTRALAAASFRKGGNLRGWLFTIMHNAFISSVRARRAADLEFTHDLPELGQAPTQLDRLEVRDVLAALARLPEAQRAALVLIALEEFSYSDAARVLGIPLGTLMSRLARGREALRRAMSEDAPPRLRVVGDQP
jgi:RNA polymerase sigma factor (sigma-70 family)